METAKELMQVFFSWQTVSLAVLIILRAPIMSVVERLIKSDQAKAKLGPVEIELGKLAEKGQEAVHGMNRLNELMVEPRLLEPEITQSMFSPFFVEEQKQRMEPHIQEFRQLVKELTHNQK